MNPEQVKATFITFYSFKGGVGRSMALINTAGILAGQRGFRVLVLDLDLEAPGLSYLDPELPDVSPVQAQQKLPLQCGFVDLLTDAKERGQDADLFTLSVADLEAKYTQKIKIPNDLRQFSDGSLRIMPAGLFDHNYAQRLEALNLSALYREGLGEPLIRAFKKKLAEAGRYDYVLVDSRTGISEGAGICTRDLADHLMILSGLNRQNVEGTCEFLREFRAATDGKQKFQIILSPMPNGEDKLLDERRQEAERRFGEAWAAKVDLSLEIPYHPQLALTEEPHIFRRRRGYLFEAYRAIEAKMLDALGHDVPTFRQRIMESLDGRNYEEALRDLRRMIRLDHGDSALYRLADELTFRRQSRRRAEGEPSQEAITFKELLNDLGGRSVMEFILDKLSLGERDYAVRRLIQVLKRISPELAERLLKRIIEFAQNDAYTLGNYAVSFERDGYLDGAEIVYKRAIEADPQNARHLGNYAIFLKNQRGDMDSAEAFYKRAIEADPKHANNLSNYAVFLEKQRGDIDGAEAFFKRAIEADPKHANNLGNYAVFLADQRGNMDSAEAFYKRAIEADPKSARHLGNYAVFLADQRGDMDSAEAFFKRAIEADPTSARNLGNYAVFLEERRGDMDGAEAFYKRAIEADPKSARHLGNYGQFLAGIGRLTDGEEKLLLAFDHVDRSKRCETAEVCFSLWLITRMQGRDAERWERHFKFLIQHGFKRNRWCFDPMLEHAEKVLSAEELEYAKALAAAFLDKSKVADLAKYPRWQALESLEPKAPPGVTS